MIFKGVIGGVRLRGVSLKASTVLPWSPRTGAYHRPALCHVAVKAFVDVDSEAQGKIRREIGRLRLSPQRRSQRNRGVAKVVLSVVLRR